MIQQDDAVADVLLETVARETGVAAFSGDDRGHPFGAQPVEQAAQLGAERARVCQAGEQRLDGVQDDALCADGVDRVSQANEQAVEVVRARLLYLARLHAHVFDPQLLALGELARIETERREVEREIVDALLERHEDAGFLVALRAVDEELHRENRLPAPRTATDQGWPALRQAATRDLVESLNPGRCLEHRGTGGRAPRSSCTHGRRRLRSFGGSVAAAAANACFP